MADRFQEAVEATGSIACVGLDPRPDLVPPGVAARAVERHGDTAEAVAAAFLEVNAAMITAIAGHCVAVKPQAACYEAYGVAGWATLVETVRLARAAGLVVIVDAKRGDIGSTATHYRQAFFGGAPTLGGAPFGAMTADWVTVNGYLGSDNVLEMAGPVPGRCGVLVLAKTSNTSSGELQDVVAGDGTVAEAVARLVARWGTGRVGRCGLSDIGAVVGATYPTQARVLREAMPDSLFLVPGYGAQGGAGVAAVAGARADGSGIVVSASRSITSAWIDADAPDAWVEAARDALDQMNAELDAAR